MIPHVLFYELCSLKNAASTSTSSLGCPDALKTVSGGFWNPSGGLISSSAIESRGLTSFIFTSLPFGSFDFLSAKILGKCEAKALANRFANKTGTVIACAKKHGQPVAILKRLTFIRMAPNQSPTKA